MTNVEIFNKNLTAHKDVVSRMSEMEEKIASAGEIIASSIAEGGTVFFCGNGGSAADAQHLAAEFSGRYLKERRPLNGVALTCNTSALTAIGNDYSFEKIYSRQLEAHGKSGDVLIAISTSGNSGNIVEAAISAHRIGISVIALTGECGGKLRDLSDVLLNVPSTETPRIQEMHILIGHTLCEMAEKDY